MEQQPTPQMFETFNSWFDITVKILQTKIAKLDVGITGDLFSSIHYQVDGPGSEVQKGYLLFNLYGRFVDMGVGRGLPIGNTGFSPSRRKKEWYSRNFYAQVMRLREISAQKIGSVAAKSIVYRIEAVNNNKPVL